MHVVVGRAVFGGVEELRITYQGVSLLAQDRGGRLLNERYRSPAHLARHDLSRLNDYTADSVRVGHRLYPVHDDTADRDHAVSARAVGLEVHHPLHAFSLAMRANGRTRGDGRKRDD